ncbi:Fic family protein [Mariprofundus erugo]|uniref:Fic family protein n=1 Tax=Mariprofundus erugo TaxID=2528639 RepID=A0A5R9GQV3_9PROT|nr:Fic family protein [Mariprofundus erugo]TLS67968.1 Fic family protein [Mariprofundus erugo]
MTYREIDYLDKIEKLQEVYPMSAAMAEAIGVSRRSLLNWRDRPESIKTEHRFNIDVLFCKHFIIPEWDKKGETFTPTLLQDDLSGNDALLMPFLRRLSYGTIEIETGMSKDDFERAVDAKKLPKNMSIETFHEAVNTYLTHKWLWHKCIDRAERFVITEESVKGLHGDFMRGIREDAGFYSQKIRVMGGLDALHTTLPEDIPEEMNRWAYKCSDAATIEAIAKAHAWFIAIHPFGDGNGRVGRALILAQCLNAGLMPPLFDSENRAIYYAAMEHAMVHGRHAPLIRLFHESAIRAR